MFSSRVGLVAKRLDDCRINEKTIENVFYLFGENTETQV